MRYLDEKEIQQEDIKIGSIIPPSYLVETGGDGKLTGLLSNGTLLTLTENTRMKVATLSRNLLRMMVVNWQIYQVSRVGRRWILNWNMVPLW